MVNSRFNVVTDGQWGSCGKGAITTALANRFRPEVISTTNMANAGHTAVSASGEKHIAKALPSAAILAEWCESGDVVPPLATAGGKGKYRPIIVVGASAAFSIDQLHEERRVCGLQSHELLIHPRAGVITEDQRAAEAAHVGNRSTKHIASTMQGCGAFLSDKVLRNGRATLAQDMPCLGPFVHEGLSRDLNYAMRQGGATILHEGSQGYSLDINHGSHYPHCTSRGTTAVQNCADMGINPRLLDQVFLVIRPFPIRVGNVVEHGRMVGYSGDAYPGQREMTWEEVSSGCGAPPEVTAGELTTVTKRLRRVFEFSNEQLEEACELNGATQIALNFANYLDWSCYGTDDINKLTDRVWGFVRRVERVSGLPVTIIGTGPQLNHVVFL